MKEIIIGKHKLYSKENIDETKIISLFNSNDNTLYYKGQILNKKFHGKGELLEKSFRYKGNFCDGEMTGKGVYSTYNLSKYNGQMKKNRYNGYGKFETHKQGLIYEGNFIDGIFEGKGEMEITSKNDSIIYNGTFKNGFFNGKGELKYNYDKIKISGNFSNGIENGEVKIKYASGGNITIIKNSNIIDKIINFNKINFDPRLKKEDILNDVTIFKKINKKNYDSNFNDTYTTDINNNLTKGGIDIKTNILIYYIEQFQSYKQLKKEIEEKEFDNKIEIFVDNDKNNKMKDKIILNTTNDDKIQEKTILNAIDNNKIIPDTINNNTKDKTIPNTIDNNNKIILNDIDKNNEKISSTTKESEKYINQNNLDIIEKNLDKAKKIINSAEDCLNNPPNYCLKKITKKRKLNYDEDSIILNTIEKDRSKIINEFFEYIGQLNDEFKMDGRGIINYKKNIVKFNYNGKIYDVKSYEGNFKNGSIIGKGLLTTTIKIKIIGMFVLIDNKNFEILNK
jgi:hypothetical protein